jgi:hypothetical protein
MILVSTFLKSLLGTQTYDQMYKVMKHNDIPITDGVVSHFSYVNKTPSKEELLLFLSRGTAVLFKEMQKGIDLLIPVLMPQGGEYILSSDYVTYILVQVKNYSKAISDPMNRTISQKMQTEEVEL